MTVVLAAVTGLITLILVAGTAVGGLLVARTQAATAADAAALAAAVATHPDTGRLAPANEARRAAQANLADLVRCTCPLNASLEVRRVVVVVAIEMTVPIFGRITVERESRAEFDPRAWLDR